MCSFRPPAPPPAPPPLPPAPVPPAPPLPPAELPDPEVRPVNPSVREAQSKLGTKKGKKGSTSDLRIKKDAASSGSEASVNTGNTNNTGGLQ